MKNKMKSIGMAFGIAIFLMMTNACNKDKDVSENTSPQSHEENLPSVNGMQDALSKMGLYNDSLLLADTTHHPLQHHYDSLYHHHDSLFWHHHQVYHHGDTVHHHGHHNQYHHHVHDSLHHAHTPHHPHHPH